MLYRGILISFFCLWPLIAESGELLTHRKGGIPQKFVGNWVIKVLPQSKKEITFPHWDYTKYPVKLKITDKNLGIFTDKWGSQCILEYVYYDPDLDIIPIAYCSGLGTKVKHAVSPMHLISEKDGKIYGEVRTYKHIFSWIGERADPFSKDYLECSEERE